MRLAWTTLGSPDWPIDRVFAECARAGYAGVEFRCLRGVPIDPHLPAADRQLMRRLSAETNLPIIGIGASSTFSAADSAARAAQEEDLRGMLELAHEVGAPLVRAYAGAFPAGEAEAVVCDRVAESVWRVVPRAKELGVAIAMETHDGLSSARVAAEVLRRIAAPQVHALWDVLHPTRMGESPAEVWDLIGPRVRHVHFKDAARDGGGRWRAKPIGEGEVPLRECLRRLHAAGYAGWLTLEWEKYWEPDIPAPEAVIDRHLQTVRGYLAEIGAQG